MKTILVIDIPDDYYEEYKDWTVNYDLRFDNNEGATESLKYVEDVKLKPLPEKFTREDYSISEDTEIAYYEGYNACIDEILGENE